MNRFIFKIIRSIIWRFIGNNIESQKYLGLLEQNLLQLMNIGAGAKVNTSGENLVFSFLKGRTVQLNEAVFFDVGANVGDYSTALKSHFPLSKIYTFEPHPSVFAKLKARHNNTDVSCFNQAFSDFNGMMSLFFDPNNSLLSSLHKRGLPNSEYKLNEEVNVQVTTIETFCNQNNITDIFFLKLDVEGHELAVLKGAERLLNEKKIQFIQFEFGGCNIDSRTFLRDFFEILKDYKIYRILANGLFEIENYSEKEERFHTTNFLAQLK